ncbi:T9SS type A sorting domain-containing protein [Winogradskyella ursingii]|uniref:T9SS type A sorting domain-containing protein n=1 Tax=Winogradskyella ursingii TaxID=2686079 RepID=UPI0015CEB1FA|nr:T9SS type A sorting domain-containing protein [Winogradskyella ursingii]
MKRLLILTSLLLLNSNFLISQICNDPNETFNINSSLEQRLVNSGIDSNGMTGDILCSDAIQVSSLNLSNPIGTLDTDKITSMDGIEAFINLEILNIDNNRIGSTFFVDDLQNLRILRMNDNLVSEIPLLVFHSSLEELYVNNNAILDLTYNDNLKILECSNNLITDLNIRNLERLDCSNNQINSLAILINSYNLEYLNCANNLISVLELSEFPLQYLDCSNNLLQNLDASNNIYSFFNFNGNNATLEFIDISNTNIGSFLHNSGILQSFKANNCNFLSRIDLRNNFLGTNTFEINGSLSIEELLIANNHLDSIGLTNLALLRDLNVQNNNLTSLNVSNNPLLTDIICDGNQISNLDFSLNPLLSNLRISTNDNNINPDPYLESLDISNTQLTRLKHNNLDGNPIRFINLLNFKAQNCNAITELLIQSQNFSTIDIQNCQVLERLVLGSNFEESFSNVGNDLIISNTPSLKFLTCPSLGLTNLNLAVLPNLEYLDCRSNILSEIDASSNTQLSFILFLNEFLQVLNVSNTKIVDLKAGGNQNLHTINASNCTQLDRVFMWNANLETLNVENSTSLKVITTLNNSISNLNINNTDALEELIMDNNSLVNLDLSANSNLKKLSITDNNLESLNIKNGNFSNLTVLRTINNPDLTCIEVDDATEAYEHLYNSSDTIWNIGSTSFSSACGSSTGHPNYDALVDFYNATGGDFWVNNTNWLDPNQPVSTWFGITEGAGRVTQLNLPFNNLTGTIPESIENLSLLFNLTLRGNNISGTLPSNLGNTNNLSFIDLSDNNIEGVIPSSILNLTSLQWLQLSNNNLNGTIPDLTTIPFSILSLLKIDNNKFVFSDFENQFNTYVNNLGTGFVYSPQKFIDEEDGVAANLGDTITLVPLQDLGTQLTIDWYTGDTFDYIGSGNSIDIPIDTVDDYGQYLYYVTSGIVSELGLQSQPITIGEPPSQHPDYDALIALYDSLDGPNWDNPWNITKPIEFWDTSYGLQFDDVTNRVTSIEYVNAGLSGVLPPEIGELTELENLFLQNNDLQGQIPFEIWNLTNLKSLLLGTNPLELANGIPTNISNMQNLEWLNLAGIPLTLPLQPEIFNLPNLIRLRVQGCGLTGTLPPEFALIDDIYADSNNFEGSIPDEILNVNGNYRLNITNNLFNFNDLEPLAQSNGYQILNYSPQRTMDIEETIESGVGANITLNVNDTNLNKVGNDTAMNNQYQWFKDNVEISGANASNFTITNAQESDSGTYHCEITNNTLPDLTIVRAPITLVVDENLSVENREFDDLLIYPNPVGNWLNIKISSLSEFKISVFDLNGRLTLSQILNTSLSSINVEHLQSGIYILRAENEESITTKRFIKQ